MRDCDETEDECPICLEPLLSKGACAELACRHRMCIECHTALRDEPCPICRDCGGQTDLVRQYVERLMLPDRETSDAAALVLATALAADVHDVSCAAISGSLIGRVMRSMGGVGIVAVRVVTRTDASVATYLLIVANLCTVRVDAACRRNVACLCELLPRIQQLALVSPDFTIRTYAWAALQNVSAHIPLPMTAAFVQALPVGTENEAVDCMDALGYRYAVVRNIRAWHAVRYTPVGGDASGPSIVLPVPPSAPERLRRGLWRKLRVLRKQRRPPPASSVVTV